MGQTYQPRKATFDRKEVNGVVKYFARNKRAARVRKSAGVRKGSGLTRAQVLASKKLGSYKLVYKRGDSFVAVR